MDGDIGDFDQGNYDHTEVANRVVDVWHPSFEMAKIAPVSAPVSPESFKKSREEKQKIMQMLSEKTRQLSDMEAVRAAHWAGLRIGVRRVVVMSANLPKERADDTLNKFDAKERGLIWLCLRKLVEDIEVAKLCMQGGKINANEVFH